MKKVFLIAVEIETSFWEGAPDGDIAMELATEVDFKMLGIEGGFADAWDPDHKEVSVFTVSDFLLDFADGKISSKGIDIGLEVV